MTHEQYEKGYGHGFFDGYTDGCRQEGESDRTGTGQSVLQPWLADWCTLKEQTVVLCALRGPDAGGSPQVKTIVRWIRGVALRNAAPKKTFMMNNTFLPDLAELAEGNPLVFDMLPVHYLGHLTHALQVIGQRHPEDGIRLLGWRGYLHLCEYLHLAPEDEGEFRKRLQDET